LNPNIPAGYCLLGSSRRLAALPYWWTQRGLAFDLLKPGILEAAGQWAKD